MLYKTFCISTTPEKLFWGWKSTIDIHEYNTIEKIIEEVKKELKDYLHRGNLDDLVKRVDSMNNLHIHCLNENLIFGNNIDNSQKVYNDEIYYLCDHC